MGVVKRFRPEFTTLERRDNPAQFGIPWPDAERLTFSFAPDGTSVAGHSSSLASVLADASPAARMEILHALQSWAVNANVNFGFVSDGGAAFGTAGVSQGDSRFGDIRIGAVPLQNDVLAVTSPYGVFSSNSGDIVLNGAAVGGIGSAGLYTIFLQEAGHALGISNSADPSSAMYEYYRGPRVGLSSGDIAAVQALYGPRTQDRFEGTSGNDSPSTATPYSGPMAADLTNLADVDLYTFHVGLLTSSVRVELHAAGLSLLAAKVEVLNAAGVVIRTISADDPLDNDLTTTLANPGWGQTYYVRVTSARQDDFGIGAYRLSIVQNSPLTGITGLVDNLLNETGLNDTLATATTLLSHGPTAGPQSTFTEHSAFGSASDVDYFSFQVPATFQGTSANLLVNLWGINGAALNPLVEVYDSNGVKREVQLLTSNANNAVIQATGLSAGESYYIKARSASGTKGDYTLAAMIQEALVTLPHGGSGTLDCGNTADSGKFSMTQTGQIHLVVEAAGTGKLVYRIRDAAGNLVVERTVQAGFGQSLDVFLGMGSYTLEIEATGVSSSIGYKFRMFVTTDPVGARAGDPTGTPAEPDPNGNPPPPPPTPAPAPQPEPDIVWIDPTWDPDHPVWY